MKAKGSHNLWRYQLEDSVDHQGVVARLLWALQLEMEKCSVKQKIEDETTIISIISI